KLWKVMLFLYYLLFKPQIQSIEPLLLFGLIMHKRFRFQESYGGDALFEKDESDQHIKNIQFTIQTSSDILKNTPTNFTYQIIHYRVVEHMFISIIQHTPILILV
ncbi:hypothetical protein PPL_05259, partial [Heterostelium album PN500]